MWAGAVGGRAGLAPVFTEQLAVALGSAGLGRCGLQWPIERSHPDQRQEANQMVSEYQPVGSECCPRGPPLSVSWPLKWERTPASQTKAPLPLNPLRSHIHPHPVLRSASQHHCPQGCWDRTGTTGLVACSRQRRALLPGCGRVPGRAGSHPSTRTKTTNRGHKPEQRRATRAGGGGRGSREDGEFTL